MWSPRARTSRTLLTSARILPNAPAAGGKQQVTPVAAPRGSASLTQRGHTEQPSASISTLYSKPRKKKTMSAHSEIDPLQDEEPTEVPEESPELEDELNEDLGTCDWDGPEECESCQ